MDRYWLISIVSVLGPEEAFVPNFIKLYRILIELRLQHLQGQTDGWGLAEIMDLY